MPTPLEALTTPLTVDQVRVSIYSVIAQLGVDTTVWKPGAVVRTMIAGVALVVAGLSQLTSQAAQSGFLESAAGTWLTLLARNVYGVERIAATFGTGSALLANSSGGIYVLDDGELQVTNGRTGATYVNVGPLTIPAVSSNVPVTLIAVQAGSGSTALATDPVTVSSPLPGVTVSLVTSIVGLDDELDPALRLRCLEKLGALSPNGPGDAYGFVARSATRADGSPVGVTRVRVIPDGAGNVAVYVTNAAGNIDPADLASVNDAIQQLATPLAVTSTVFAATPHPIDVTATVFTYRAGLDNASVSAAISGEILAFLETVPIGGNLGFVHRAALMAAMGRVSTVLPVFNILMSSADYALGATDVATLGTVSLTIVQVPAPLGV